MNRIFSVLRDRQRFRVPRLKSVLRVAPWATLALLVAAPSFAQPDPAGTVPDPAGIGTPAARTPGSADHPAGTPPADDTAPVTLDEALGERADPLNDIEQQIEAQEYAPAIRTLERRIDDIQERSHRYDRRLVRPLTLLGDAEAGLGEYDSALDHYRRALHLSRVNDGLNSPDQVDIVYREAETFKALGDYRQANDREEYAYHVLNRAHDPMDENLLPGIYHLAGWYEKISNVFAARTLYEQAVRIIDAHDKLETAEAIPALEGIANSYRLERFPPYYLADIDRPESSVVTPNAVRHQAITVNNFPAGESALQRIVSIRQQNRDQDPIALAEAVLELADWHTLFDKTRRAVPLYAHAWDIMSDVESFDVVGYFSEPKLLYFPAPGNPTPPPVNQRGERSTGYVEVAFDVTEDGRVRDLSTVASEPDGLMDFRVRKSLRLARYRPMLVDGVPVATASHTYRHEFPYYPRLEVDAQTAGADTGG